MLSGSCLMPDGWVNVPLPDETYDLDKPGVFLPLLVCMAPYDSGDSTERDRARLGWFFVLHHAPNANAWKLAGSLPTPPAPTPTSAVFDQGLQRS